MSQEFPENESLNLSPLGRFCINGTRPEATKANEIHRLIITPSKHLYLRSNGNLCYRKKPIDYKLGRPWTEGLEPIVYYIVVDDYSKTLFAKTRRAANLTLPEDFVFQAWRPKEETKAFFGRPQKLIVPKNIFDRPLLNLCINAEIQYRHPTSGFEALPHITKEWDHHFSDFADKKIAFETFVDKADKVITDYTNQTDSPWGDSRLSAWKRTVVHPHEVSDPATFRQLLTDPNDLPFETELKLKVIPTSSPLRKFLTHPDSPTKHASPSPIRKPQTEQTDAISENDDWQKMARQAIKLFDFQRLHRILVTLDWTWDMGERVFETIRVPTIKELQNTAIDLLNNVRNNPGSISSLMGMAALNFDGIPFLIFAIEAQFGNDKEQCLNFRRFMDSY